MYRPYKLPDRPAFAEELDVGLASGINSSFNSSLHVNLYKYQNQKDKQEEGYVDRPN